MPSAWIFPSHEGMTPDTSDPTAGSLYTGGRRGDRGELVGRSADVGIDIQRNGYFC